jgi:D-alanine-D-alanine ligase
MANLIVLFGGPSPEHDVSILTGLQACRALLSDGREVTAVYWSKAGTWHEVPPALEAPAFANGVPDQARSLRLLLGPEGGFVAEKRVFGSSRPLPCDVAVICCHGGPGEDGTLQSALDLCGIRYTGPSAAAASLGMDKLAFGGLVGAGGLPTLPRALLTPEQVGEVPFPGPYLVKPRFGGSSIGIEVVEDASTARALAANSVHMRRGAVVEPFMEQIFDVNIAIRTYPQLQVSAIEQPTKSSTSTRILSYAEKYVGSEGMSSAPRVLPAVLPDQVERQIISAAKEVARLTAVRGVARLDFLCDGDAVYVNELNTIPGSLAKYLWIKPMIGFTELLQDMIDEALTHETFITTTQGADGSVLRSAGSIAAKLA